MGDKHDQTVDPDPLARRRRHPVLEGADEILIHPVSLLISTLSRPQLFLEALTLFLRIVQLRIGVRQLEPCYEELEPLGQSRIVRPTPGQGGKLEGEVEEERRLDQVGLHQMRHQRVDKLAPSPPRLYRNAALGSHGPQPLGTFQILLPDSAHLPESLHARPSRAGSSNNDNPRTLDRTPAW